MTCLRRLSFSLRSAFSCARFAFAFALFPFGSSAWLLESLLESEDDDFARLCLVFLFVGSLMSFLSAREKVGLVEAFITCARTCSRKVPSDSL